MDEKKTGISDGMRNRVRAGIYPLAGIYLIYLAYCMFHEISVTSGNEQIRMIVFSILFSIFGLAMILLGISMTIKNNKKNSKQEE